MRRSVGITVSAMILAAHLGSPLAAAQPTTEQLSQIAAYLSDNDVQALRAYLLLHPELLEEDTVLARLLREFMAESEDMQNFLGFEPDLRDSIEAITNPGAAGPDEPDDPGGVLY